VELYLCFYTPSWRALGNVTFSFIFTEIITSLQKMLTMISMIYNKENESVIVLSNVVFSLIFFARTSYKHNHKKFYCSEKILRLIK
jgi:hypothetical protein